jgi:MinD superfamily P-loop ATPase
MIVTVASGKGGTGKTTFAVNLAYVLASQGESVRLLDCDVEEPNDHLFVKPVFSEQCDVTVPKPVWDAAACTGCGACAAACRYNALAVVKGKVLIFNELCHSCGVCSEVCPEQALHEQPVAIGKVRSAPGHQPLFFADGLLTIGESLAPNVVDAVKSHADPEAINLIDAAPGTACPVVKALTGADVAVLLTEPTPFGLNDLKLAVAMTLQMGIPTGIVINRSSGKDEIIADYAEAVGVPILGRIPFERRYAETYASGGILVEHHGELQAILLAIYENIQALPGTVLPPVPAIADFLADAALVPEPSQGSATGFREVTIISGKGGTGKTTVAAAFAALAKPVVLADNDVDAADLHLLLTPRVREAHPYVGGMRATIDPDTCIGCGECAAACHFGAIHLAGQGNALIPQTWQIDPFGCEGCGLCALVCPVDNIRNDPVVTGQWYVSATDWGPMAHARLGIAAENSGRLVTQVRNRAAELATEERRGRILGDGPPGTGCPVIASISGTDLVVIVTEPTVSGVHDLGRVLDLVAHFGVPARVIINKVDINAEQAARIGRIAGSRGSKVIGRIPFDPCVNDALVAGKTIVDYAPGPAAEAVRKAWEEMCAVLSGLADGSAPPPSGHGLAQEQSADEQ